MRGKLIRRTVILGILIVVFTMTSPSATHADPLVLRGFDLFTTVAAGTKVNLGPAGLQSFKGVPIGSFDFGGGSVNTGATDTIVQRLGDASLANPTIPLQIVALQFMSVNQFDLGAGNDFHFITLQSARGGPASTGTASFVFGPEGSPHGTFDSTLNVFFDVRVGSLDGPIVFSGIETLTVIGALWSHFPPPDAVLIPGVNFLLNGENQLNDLFALGLVIHVSPADGSMHTVQTAVPEPTTLGLLVVGLAGVVGRVYRRRAEGK